MRKHEYEHDGREHAVELKDAGDHLVEARVTTQGASAVVRFHATDLGGGRYVVRVGDEVHDVFVVRDATGAGLRVRLATGEVAFERLDPFRDAVRKGRHGGGTRKVTSPIPGRVVDVLVQVGDEVAQGQPVVIVEAMKMANELRAPIAGRVVGVSASKGAAVDAGASLVVIEG